MENVIELLEEQIKECNDEIRGDPLFDSTVFLDVNEAKRILSILKKQESELKEYHKADEFLDAHGWKW